MKIVLVDYQGTRKEFELKDIPKEIFIYVITGDEVTHIIYEDGSTDDFDTSDCRHINYYDGEYALPVEKLEEFNKLEGDSYDRMDICYEWEEEYFND